VAPDVATVAGTWQWHALIVCGLLVLLAWWWQVPLAMATAGILLIPLCGWTVLIPLVAWYRPQSTSCPTCRQRRRVDGMHCPACGAGWESTPADGRDLTVALRTP
jgi:hypothetical protein